MKPMTIFIAPVATVLVLVLTIASAEAQSLSDQLAQNPTASISANADFEDKLRDLIDTTQRINTQLEAGETTTPTVEAPIESTSVPSASAETTRPRSPLNTSWS